MNNLRSFKKALLHGYVFFVAVHLFCLKEVAEQQLSLVCGVK